MLVDTVNVDTIGVVVASRNPARSAAATRQIIDGSPGAFRRLRLGRQAPDALLIPIRGAIEGVSLTQLQDRIDQFKFILRPQREFTLEWSDTQDAVGREWQVFRHQLAIDDIPPGWVNTAVRFSAALIAADPRARETTLQTDNDAGAQPRVIQPSVGTAPMPVTITIVGNAGAPLVDPVIQYRNGADAVLQTLSFTGTLTGTDTVIINTETFSVTLNAANAGGSIAGTYFDVDPGDGDYLGSPTAPDVRLSATSGTADIFRVEYFRRYW